MNLDYVRAYHLIVEEEARILSNEQRIEEGRWYSVTNLKYYIERDQLKELLKKKGYSNPDEVINFLINRGFLVQLPESPEDGESHRLRSLHMDILVRSSQITTEHGRPPYLLSSKFTLSKLKVPAREDRTIIPTLGAGFPADSLWSAVLSFFKGDQQLAETYVNIMKDYLGHSGLDSFQTHVLYSMLTSETNTHAIIAPTGSGKTEIYLFYLLAKLMKWRILEKDARKKALLVYPRKALTVDQAYRIVKLLSKANRQLNRINVNLTFAIRDGETPRKREQVEDGTLFRGVNCPICNNQLIYSKKSGKERPVVRCKQCGREYSFIKVVRDEVAEADIIATNPWALEVRLLDNSTYDVNANAISNVGLLVFDEVHEYTGLSGGIMASLIDVMRSINNYGHLEIVFSSATVPDPQDFILKLSGDNTCRVYDFQDLVIKRKIVNIVGERLIILGYFAMNPQYSWVTYCQLWAVLMAFLSYAYKLREMWQPQSVLFVNNLKELRRIRSGYEESLRLGEPKDHLKEDLESLDPYCYWHYLPVAVRRNISQLEGEKLFNELNYRVAEVHSEAPKEEKESTVSRLRRGDGLVALSTSSLELGVDYDGVGFILNVGLDNPISLIQRVGRGGRSDRTLRTVLGLFLVRALPTEMLKTYDENFMRALATTSFEGYKLLITRDNPQIVKRRILIEAVAKLAKKNLETYASGRGIQSLEALRSLIENVLGEII